LDFIVFGDRAVRLDQIKKVTKFGTFEPAIADRRQVLANDVITRNPKGTTEGDSRKCDPQFVV
jgi:hypothetical protein